MVEDVESVVAIGEVMEGEQSGAGTIEVVWS